jgi:predicted regulator of Ras-like GTPase activity (Roadblock/LC7/MglB family)
LVEDSISAMDGLLSAATVAGKLDRMEVCACFATVWGAAFERLSSGDCFGVLQLISYWRQSPTVVEMFLLGA